MSFPLYRGFFTWRNNPVLVIAIALTCAGACAAQEEEIVPTGPADSNWAEPVEIQEATGDVSAEMQDGFNPSLYTPPPIEPVDRRPISQERWEEASNHLDYSSDLPKPQKQQQSSNNVNMPDWNFSTAGIGKVLQVLAILLALAAIGFAIYRTMQAPRNRRIGKAQDGTIITLENVDAYIHETDLERFLREALASSNFSLAIRLYYLQIIKTLSEKGAIKWSIEKTNRDYLRETREHPLGSDFREVTRNFEKIWYGNEQLGVAGYQAMEPSFKSLLERIR